MVTYGTFLNPIQINSSSELNRLCWIPGYWAPVWAEIAQLVAFFQLLSVFCICFQSLTFHAQRPERCGEILWQFCLQQEEECAGVGDPSGLHIIWYSEICGEHSDSVWNECVDQTRTAEAEGSSPSMAGTKYSKDIFLRRAQIRRNVNRVISSQDFIRV